MTVEMEVARLEYHGRAMRWAPTRIRCLQAFGPLDMDEPVDTDIFYLLGEGYSVFVELQPGDATRYGLLLTSGAYGVNATRVGSACDGSVRVALDVKVTQEMCAVLAPFNEWTQIFFAWWLNELRMVGVRGQ